MRIDGNKALNGAGRGGVRRRAEGNGSAFTVDEGTASSPARASEAPAPISGVEALIALQAVEHAGGEKGRRLRHGHDMLDLLEDIKIGLLGGQIPAAKLERLAERLRQRPDRNGSAAVEHLLDEIELRARVELAKLGREAA